MVNKSNCVKCGCPCHCKWDCCENGACGCDICHCGSTKSEEDIPSSFVNPNT